MKAQVSSEFLFIFLFYILVLSFFIMYMINLNSQIKGKNYYYKLEAEYVARYLDLMATKHFFSSKSNIKNNYILTSNDAFNIVKGKNSSALTIFKTKGKYEQE